MGNTPTKQEERLAARDARRAAQRAAALQRVTVVQSKPSNRVAVVIGAGGTAVWIALAGWSYTAATVGDMIFAGVLLVLAFMVAVAALMASERYGGFANRRRLVFSLTFAGAMAAVSSLLFWWEYSHRPMPNATADEISDKVISKLPGSTQKSETKAIILNNVKEFAVQGGKIIGYDTAIDAKNLGHGKVTDTLIEKRKP
jgi:hypothetical protein